MDKKLEALEERLHEVESKTDRMLEILERMHSTMQFHQQEGSAKEM